MKIFVTGSSGYLGGALLSTAILHEMIPGAEVLSVSRDEGADYQIDLRIEEIKFDQRPDVIIHCAGNSSASESVISPLGSIESNLLTLLPILEFTRSEAVKLILVSSIKTQPLTYDISRSVYGAAKLAGEILANEYRLQYGMHLNIVRFPALYGAPIKLNKKADQSWINWFCKANCDQTSISIVGDPTIPRYPIHVRDACRVLANMVLTENNQDYDILGSFETPYSPKTIADMIESISGRKFETILQKPARIDMRGNYVKSQSSVDINTFLRLFRSDASAEPIESGLKELIEVYERQ